MAVMEVRCPECHGLNVVRYGRQPNGKQRYLCQDPHCARRIFLLPTPGDATLGRMPAEMRLVIERALMGREVEETARDLRLPAGTVAEVFELLARFKAPPGGISRPAQTIRRRRAG